MDQMTFSIIEYWLSSFADFILNLYGFSAEHKKTLDPFGFHCMDNDVQTSTDSLCGWM